MALFAASLGAVSLTAAPASAEPAPSVAAGTDGRADATSLTAGPANGGFAAQAVSPSGCMGQSNNPHRSGHVPGTINAEARTYCNNPVPELYARAELLRFYSGAWRVVHSNYGLDFQKVEVSAFANEPYCSGTSYYALDSYHEVIDVDRQPYWGWTASPVVSFNCPE